MTTRHRRQVTGPLLIKRILHELGITQMSWSRMIGSSGYALLRPSTANEILNHSKFPASVNRDEVVSKTIQILIDRGVDPDIANRSFEFDDQELQVIARSAVAPAAELQDPTLNYELPENEMLSDVAKKHFQLFQNPFIDDVQKSEDIYLAADQQYVKSAMWQACKHGGFIAVVGESGAGKTTLRRDLLDRIIRNESNIRVVMPRTVDKTRLSAGAICDAIIADMNQSPKASLEAKARQIESLLTESSRAGNSHVLIIEEAHDLTKPVLKYLKRFWELEDGFTKLISILLIAQPELKNKLNEYANPEVREVARRCELIELKPLNGNLEEYLTLKFTRVGKQLTDIFDDDAFDALRARMSIHRGNSRVAINMMYPLVVNNTVTKAMNMCAEFGQAKVNKEIIQEI